MPPKYGAATQYMEYDTMPEVNKDDQRYTQQVTGKKLWMAHAVDEVLLTALSTIASHQSKPTKTTMKCVKQLLEYIAL